MAWQTAFEQIRSLRNFSTLHQLLENVELHGLNDLFVWDNYAVTPLFAAVLLQLDDHVPKLIANGAEPAVQCLFQGLRCCPIHAAALRGDVPTLRALMNAQCDVTLEGEAFEDLESPTDFVGWDALQLCVTRDIFNEEVYRELLQRGLRLTRPHQQRNGHTVPGLLVPRHLGNLNATEEKLDWLMGEEVKYILRSSTHAGSLNALLELVTCLRREHNIKIRFADDVDFDLGVPASPLPTIEVATALQYAAEVGNLEAARLLLYAGGSAGRTVRRTMPFGQTHVISIQTQAIHLALMRGDSVMVEQLLLFGGDPCVASGEVFELGQATEAEETWTELTLIHVAVLCRHAEVIPDLLRCECGLETPACRAVGMSTESVPPLHLAVLLNDVPSTTALLDAGAVVSDQVRAKAVTAEAICEMFGGEVIGLEDWISALLTGKEALRALLDRRTDLCRVLDWSEGLSILEKHEMPSPNLKHLSCVLTGPTILRGVRPVHLAILLQQPWAVCMLAEAGVSVAKSPPCEEVLRDEAAHVLDSSTTGIALDAVLLAARIGSSALLELLVEDGRFRLPVQVEIPVAPDLTPPFFPLHLPAVGLSAGLTTPVWAWRRLGPLELALMRQCVEVAVLLVGLGADLMHRVDHVAIAPPTHYSVTNHCFLGLTPLHLCAMLDFHVAAAALLEQACSDGAPVVPTEHPRPQRQALLAATCAQAWCTLGQTGCTESELWVWRDLTPLHLAILSNSHATGELLAQASTPETLSLPCIHRDAGSNDERCWSALLLAFERNAKDLHRQIAKRLSI